MKMRHFANSLAGALTASLSPLFGWPIWVLLGVFVIGGLLGWHYMRGKERRRMEPRTSTDQRKTPYAVEARYRAPGFRLWTLWTPWRVLWAFAVQAVRNAFLTELEKNNSGDAQYRSVDYDRRKEDKKDYPKWR